MRIEYDGGPDQLLEVIQKLEEGAGQCMVVEELQADGNWRIYGMATKLFAFRVGELVVLRIAFQGWIGNDQAGVRGHVVTKASVDQWGWLSVELRADRVWRIRPAYAGADGEQSVALLHEYLEQVQKPAIKARGKEIQETYERIAGYMAKDWTDLMLPELEAANGAR
jgi:hypothetical protein